MRSFLSFAISCFYSLFLAKLKRIPIYPFAPCTGPQIIVSVMFFDRLYIFVVNVRQRYVIVLKIPRFLRFFLWQTVKTVA